MTPTMDYYEAREKIKNGDLISFRVNGRNFLHRLTSWLTKSPYYHTAIAVWLKAEAGTSRLFVSEAHGAGRRLLPMSAYLGKPMDVTPSPVAFNLIEAPMLANVGMVPYGFFVYLAIGIRLLFGITARDDKGAEICSELPQRLYIRGGLDLPAKPLAPSELKELVNARGFVDTIYIR